MKPCLMAIWIDRREAHIFHVEAATLKTTRARAPDHVLRHPRYEPAPRDRTQDDRRFFAAVAQSLAGARDVLVMGPCAVKFDFRDYVGARAATLSFGVVGVETVERPTHIQVATYMCDYFALARPSATRAHEAP